MANEKQCQNFLVAKLVYALEMDELQYSIWLLSTPVKAEKNRAKPESTKVKYQASNHYKDLSLIRIHRDHENAQKMFEFLAERDPFQIDKVLINLNSGEVIDESVNVFQVQAIGESLIQGIAGTAIFDYKFKNKYMAIITKTNAFVNIEESVVEVDPRLFFERLIVFIQLEEINDTFNY